MTIITGKARKLKKRLLREHRKTGSWRVLARQYPPVKFGTLQRFATDPEYIPVDVDLLVALGLRKPRAPRPPREPIPEWVKPIRKQIAWMAKQTRQSLGRQ